ncbi:MAG: aldo/keto reductase [Phycisphaerae bacterium]|nr:aldo/keto reductase [Phycisphaerae bacterium]
MKTKQINRRNFLRNVGAAGLAGAFVSKVSANDPNKAEPNEPVKKTVEHVGKRKLGRTGVEVPELSLGAMFDVTNNQIALNKAAEWGVTYWDTANGYAGGNSELGIGKYLKRNPEMRKNLFIVTKASGAENVLEIEQRLRTSFERMNTDYIDLYYGVHGLKNPADLTEGLKQWAADAKKRGAIKYFGFSTHSNMANCLKAAAQTDWIDAIMTSCNFRLMQDKEMQEAVEACHKAGIGLIAMKTQAYGQGEDGERELMQHFLEKGFTSGQAKIKYVLDDPRIASACVGMKSVSLLSANVAAVLDKTKLTLADKKVFSDYAKRTCGGYCIGCGLCNGVADGISDTMRLLMYNNWYGEKQMARQLFGQMPAAQRQRMLNANLAKAEKLCPQGLAICALVTQAARTFA